MTTSPLVFTDTSRFLTSLLESPISEGDYLRPSCQPRHRVQDNRRTGRAEQRSEELGIQQRIHGYGFGQDKAFQQGICQPRWTPDAARLFNGNGTAPFSAGLVPRQEFFDAVARQDVRRALRAESEALCKARAPQRRYRWQEPPRLAQEVKAERFPLLEQPELLSDPNVIDRSEQRLLNGGT